MSARRTYIQQSKFCARMQFYIGAPVAFDDERVLRMHRVFGGSGDDLRGIPTWDMMQPTAREYQGLLITMPPYSETVVQENQARLRLYLRDTEFLLYYMAVHLRKEAELMRQENTKKLLKVRTKAHLLPMRVHGYMRKAPNLALVDAVQPYDLFVDFQGGLLQWFLKNARGDLTPPRIPPFTYTLRILGRQSKKELKKVKFFDVLRKDKTVVWNLEEADPGDARVRDVEEHVRQVLQFFVFNCALPYLASLYTETADGTWRTARVTSGSLLSARQVLLDNNQYVNRAPAMRFWAQEVQKYNASVLAKRSPAAVAPKKPPKPPLVRGYGVIPTPPSSGRYTAPHTEIAQTTIVKNDIYDDSALLFMRSTEYAAAPSKPSSPYMAPSSDPGYAEFPSTPSSRTQKKK